MSVKIICIVLFLMFFGNTTVMCQICVETKMSWRNVPETHMFTYSEAYERSDCLFFCTDTRIASAVGTRIVRKEVPEQIHVCCDGYVEEGNTSSSIHCKPYCSISCINGYCKSPDTCACKPGFISDTLEPHKCLPLCLKGCEHGTCEAPNTCKCNQGYESFDGVCKPICFEPCINSTCMAPDTCQCLPGYKKSKNGICKPYCNSYTANGDCINSITCEAGWAKVIKGTLEICEPICSEPCVNGICIAPGTCECLRGYVKSVFGSCEPHCSYGCPNGRCISPETCNCNPGWFKKESNGMCLAHCDRACGNGTCVGPNVCECYPGYKPDESKLEEQLGHAICISVCENCEGSHVCPEECICERPLVPTRVLMDGTPCDSEEKQCERVICSMTTTTTTTIIAEVKFEDATELSNGVTKEYDTGTSNTNDFYEFRLEKASWSNFNWFYGLGSVLLTAILLILLTAFLKKKCLKTFENPMFSSTGGDVAPTVHYKQTSVS